MVDFGKPVHGSALLLEQVEPLDMYLSIALAEFVVTNKPKGLDLNSTFRRCGFD